MYCYCKQCSPRPHAPQLTSHSRLFRARPCCCCCFDVFLPIFRLALPNRWFLQTRNLRKTKGGTLTQSTTPWPSEKDLPRNCLAWSYRRCRIFLGSRRPSADERDTRLGIAKEGGEGGEWGRRGSMCGFVPCLVISVGYVAFSRFFSSLLL